MRFPFTGTFIASFILLAWAIPCRASGTEANARELIDSLGCRGCHVIERRGGALGPSLHGVGSRLSSRQLRGQVTEPRAENPASVMPSYDHLSGDQLDRLVDFLQNLK